jgi:hypothetical protein
MKFPRRNRSAIKNIHQHFFWPQQETQSSSGACQHEQLAYGSRTKALVMPVVLILTAYAPKLAGDPSTFRKSEPTVTKISLATGIRSSRQMQSASIRSNFCQTPTFLQLLVTVVCEITTACLRNKHLFISN